jgi:hypothetical protein
MTAPNPASHKVPALQNGDTLTRDEFERRYYAMPPGTRAELIEGVVHMPSPVRWRSHGNSHTRLSWWMATYAMKTPGLEPGDNATVRLSLNSEPQPDLTMIISPSCGGQARIDDDDYLEGAPEFAAEIAASSVSIARHAKLNVYRRNGVREYLIWRILDEAIDWFVLRKKQYEPIVAGEGGILKSEIFPGLWLDPAAMVRNDMDRVGEVLQRGMASPAYAEFKALLASRGNTSSQK